MANIKTKATLTCPECKTKQKVVMPTEGKQHFYKCANEKCGLNISTQDGECCVFCSHSNRLCPIKQVDPDEGGKPRLQSLI